MGILETLFGNWNHSHDSAEHGNHDPAGGDDHLADRLLARTNAGEPGHIHVRAHSDAVDSDHDGFSDAVERLAGTNPYDSHSHPSLLHGFLGHDVDGDGFPDALERLVGVNPHDALSHPAAVEAHHFAGGTDENQPDVWDAMLRGHP
jgi:hypothetical protein